MPQQTLRIAVAGAGAFGREHLSVLARRDDVTIAGVADVSAVATGAAVADFGAERTFADAEAMLDALGPDGLIVASPGFTHLPITTAALRRDIPVLLEKPVGLSTVEADALIAAEADSRAFVLPGHILRFSAPYREMVRIAQSGEIGAILAVKGRKHRDDSHAVRYADVDPVLMTMVHDIDLTLWITGGTLQSVLTLRRPADTPRSETIVAGSDSAGVLWNLTNAWTIPSECPPDRVEIIGDRGSVEMEAWQTIRVFGRKARTIEIVAGAIDDMLATELGTFLGGIRQGAHPGVVTLTDARNGLAAMEAILASLCGRQGGDGMTIADAHLHFFRHGFPGVHGVPLFASEIDIYEALRQRYDIAAALVIGYQGGGIDSGNNAYIRELAERRPWMATLAYVEPADMPSGGTIEEHLHAGHAGLSIYVMTDAAADALARWTESAWGALDDAGAVVSFNIGLSRLPVLEKIAKAAPKCRFLVSHLGMPGKRPPPTLHRPPAEELAPLTALADQANVLVKLSGFYAISEPSHAWPHDEAAPLVETLFAAFGKDRLVWGSDFSPALDHVSFTQTLIVPGLDSADDATRDAIMGGNLLRLLGRA